MVLYNIQILGFLAYVDPGSGGFLLQLILGGVAGIGLLLKLIWNRFKFSSRTDSPRKEE